MPRIKRIPQSKQIQKFQERLKGLSGRELAQQSKTSMQWFRKSVMRRMGKDKTSEQRTGGRNWVNSKLGGGDVQGIQITKVPEIGRMMFFMYNPKWAKELKYYDKFPLVIPIGYYPDGFLGLNIHYLPFILRAKLLDALFTLHENYNDEDYVNVSYKVLKGIGNTVYKPTIKRYLYSHVASTFAVVPFDEWEVAAMLPVEDFRKANKREVWADSKAYVGR